MTCAVPFLLLLPILPRQTPTAEDIMCRVAENQDRAIAARAAYVYDMNVFVRLQRSGGVLAREESRDYVVAPTEKGARRKLVKVEGKILEGKKEIAYTTAGYRTKDMDIDGALTDTFARDAMWRKSELGPMVDWFPLTRRRQEKYVFRLEGEENYRGFEVYRITYHHRDGDDADCWTGEALIEKSEFQPVLVTNQWQCKVPVAVKALLGSNVTQVGAKIAYQRLDKDVWFPVTCGGEMKLRVLFLYARTIAFSVRSADFHKTEVKSSIEFDPDDNQ